MACNRQINEWHPVTGCKCRDVAAQLEAAVFPEILKISWGVPQHFCGDAINVYFGLAPSSVSVVCQLIENR